MSDQESIAEKVIRFLDGEMIPEEEKAFREQLETDVDLQEIVRRHRQIKDDLESLGQEDRLKEQMKEWHGEVDRPSLSPMRKWFAVAAVIVALVGIGVVWNQMEGEEEKEVAQQEALKEGADEGAAKQRGESPAEMEAGDAEKKEVAMLHYVDENEFGVLVGSKGRMISLETRKLYKSGVSLNGDSIDLQRMARGRTFSVYKIADGPVGFFFARNVDTVDTLYTWSTDNGQRIPLEGSLNTNNPLVSFGVSDHLQTGRGMPVVTKEDRLVGVIAGFEGDRVLMRTVATLKSNVEMLGKLTTQEVTASPKTMVIALEK